MEQIEPGDEIAPGVTALAAPGHTPGHLAVEVASDGERLLHIVDAALDPVSHLRHPDWFAAPDNWPAPRDPDPAPVVRPGRAGRPPGADLPLPLPRPWSRSAGWGELALGAGDVEIVRLAGPRFSPDRARAISLQPHVRSMLMLGPVEASPS